MRAEVKVVFQTTENLHKAIPHHKGDWYFTGNYPTLGGMKVANKAYVNFMDGKLVRPTKKIYNPFWGNSSNTKS